MILARWRESCHGTDVAATRRMTKVVAISSPLCTYFKMARKWNLQLILVSLTVKLFLLCKRWKTYTPQPHKYAPFRYIAVCAACVCSLSLEPSWLTRGSQSLHQIRTPEVASGDDRDTEEKSQQWLPDAFEMPKLQSASSCLIKCYSDCNHPRDKLAPPFSSRPLHLHSPHLPPLSKKDLLKILNFQFLLKFITQ